MRVKTKSVGTKIKEGIDAVDKTVESYSDEIADSICVMLSELPEDLQTKMAIHLSKRLIQRCLEDVSDE